MNSQQQAQTNNSGSL